MRDSDASEDARAALAFADEPGSSRSKWIALAIAAMLAIWMGSGFIWPAEEPAPETGEITGREAVAVAVRDSQSEEITRYFVAEGQARPDRETMIRAETAGEIASVRVRKGMILEGGQPIADFDVAERQSALERAEAELARAERDFDNAQTLLERGVATVDRVANTRADLADAEAQVDEAEEAIENTVIRAPFSGLLDELVIDPGEYVTTGAEVGRIIDSDPLTIEVQAPQQTVGAIEPGQTAQVEFVTGQTLAGEVTYVSGSADSATRTFRVEIEVENPDAAIPAGVSARVRAPIGSETAHFVSPAILSLGADGTLGVKTVGDDGNVVFHPIEIVRAQTGGVWVSGLPNEARIITVGQGFVSDGESVDPQPASGDSPALLAAESDGEEATGDAVVEDAVQGAEE